MSSEASSVSDPVRACSPRSTRKRPRAEGGAAGSRATRQRPPSGRDSPPSTPLLARLTDEQEAAVDAALSWENAPRYPAACCLAQVSQAQNACWLNAALWAVLLPASKIVSDVLSRKVEAASKNRALLDLWRRWAVLLRFGGIKDARVSNAAVSDMLRDGKGLGACFGRQFRRALRDGEQEDAATALHALLRHVTNGWVGLRCVASTLDPKQALSIADRFTVLQRHGEVEDQSDEIRFDVPDQDRESFMDALLRAGRDAGLSHQGDQRGHVLHLEVPPGSRGEEVGCALGEVHKDSLTTPHPFHEATTVNTYAHPGRRVPALGCSNVPAGSAPQDHVYAMGGAVDLLRGDISGGLANNEALAEAMLPSFSLSRRVTADAEDPETAMWGANGVRSGLMPRQARMLRSDAASRYMFMCAWHVGVYQLATGSPFPHIRATFDRLTKIMRHSRRALGKCLQGVGMAGVLDDCAAAHEFVPEDILFDRRGTQLLVMRSGHSYQLTEARASRKAQELLHAAMEGVVPLLVGPASDPSESRGPTAPKRMLSPTVRTRGSCSCGARRWMPSSPSASRTRSRFCCARRTRCTHPPLSRRVSGAAGRGRRGRRRRSWSETLSGFCTSVATKYSPSLPGSKGRVGPHVDTARRCRWEGPRVPPRPPGVHALSHTAPHVLSARGPLVRGAEEARPDSGHPLDRQRRAGLAHPECADPARIHVCGPPRTADRAACRHAP